MSFALTGEGVRVPGSVLEHQQGGHCRRRHSCACRTQHRRVGAEGRVRWERVYRVRATAELGNSGSGASCRPCPAPPVGPPPGGWGMGSRAGLDLEDQETRSLPRRGCSACLGSWGVESPAKAPLSGRAGSSLVISAVWCGREGIPRVENEQQEAKSPPGPQEVRLRHRAGPSP